MADPPYRDPNLAVDARVADLLGRMTIEEKAGQLFHTMLSPGPGGTLAGPEPTWGLEDTRTLLEEKHMTHFNLAGPVFDARQTAAWHNALQRHVLAHTRLGIPVTLSSDPRSHVGACANNVGTGAGAGAMSRWPGTLGLTALRDEGVARSFAGVVRREYAALGLRVALHPQADVATEPRWARNGTTFGEDAGLVAELTTACVAGLQGDGDGAGLGSGVSTVTKHFPGAGPELDGEDSHFVYGKEQVYPGGKFEYHLEPFRRAIAAGARQIMPSYAIPVGTKYEQVGCGFNKGIITGLLREELGFDGIVLTDWGLITDGVIAGQSMPARAWGCEHLSELERAAKILDAGCDQVGGESRPDLIVQAVEQGLLSEARVDESVRRILKEKFVLGLFDEKRFVDEAEAPEVVGNSEFVALGKLRQREALTILTNHGSAFPLRLPQESRKFYVEGIDAATVAKRGVEIVADPAEADVALVRLNAPYEAREGGFEKMFHAGSLEFTSNEAARLAKIIEVVPTSIVDVHLDRAAVLTPIVEAQQRAHGTSDEAKRGSALLVDFGIETEIFLDVCFGEGEGAPRGKLPFELPRSMQAVQSSREDVPFDTEDALFKFGHGL